MKTKIQRWGNSLAVRIPKGYSEEVGLSVGTPVDLTLVKQGLLVVPVTERVYTLDELLAGVTDSNLHAEVDTGPAQGSEAS